MSDLLHRYFQARYGPPLSDDPGFGVYTTPRVPKSPASSPRRRCNGDPPVEEIEQFFKIEINQQEYKPEEIEVKKVTIKNDPYLVIEAKKKHKSGIVLNDRFCCYPMPDGVTMKDFVKEISPTGVLTVTGSKKVPAGSRRQYLTPSRPGFRPGTLLRKQ